MARTIVYSADEGQDDAFIGALRAYTKSAHGNSPNANPIELYGRPSWAGGGGGNPDKGGKPPGAGSKKGELFGDQYVLFRDLDPTDGGGDGEPVKDANGQHIAIGYDATGILGGADGLFPIYYEADAEGDYEIPADLLPYVQEVELERANVARAPAKVMEKALAEALGKIATASDIMTDPAGRIMYSTDGTTYSTIDSPLENLALYQYLMTPVGDEDRAWPSVTDHWPPELVALLGADLAQPAWDPSSLIGAAFSKEGKVTLDALLYENTTLGINKVTGSGATLSIDYFDFSTKGGTASETYDYDRAARYEDVWLKWYEDTDGDPSNLEVQYGTAYDAVFAETPWADTYFEIDDNGTPDDMRDDEFVIVPADNAGVNDFAAAADDARAVILFMHTYGAVQVDEAEVPPEWLMA